MKALRVLVLILLAAGLVGFAAPPATDCPPGSPDCPLEPPQTVEINPNPRTADGELAPVEEPGALMPVQAVIPMPAPTYVDIVPLPEPAPSFETLDVGMRYQGEADVSCGVQALGMALEGLGAPPPTSSSLLDFLQQNGMFYDFGTGVEELAYAAQAHGYGGAYAFHYWDMDMLADELAAGHPVVAALGANGEGQPGHFVTVTGISPDGQWVAFNDPTLGEQRIRADEFAALWALQSNSGVRVALDPPATSSGEMDLFPWVALAAGVMALVTQFPWGQRREGIGGALAKDVDGEDVVRVVPRTTVKDPPPPRRPSPPRNGDRPLAQPAWPPEPIEPPAPVSPSRIADEVSLVGGGVTEDAEGLLVHRALAAPHSADADAEVPSMREDAVLFSGKPPAETWEQVCPVLTLPVGEVPILVPSLLQPEDEGFAGIDWPGSIREPLSWTGRLLKVVRLWKNVAEVSPLQFHLLETGYVGVRVSDAISAGGKGIFRQNIPYGGYAGTRYLPETIAEITAGNTLARAASNGSLAPALGISLATNIYDYTLGEHQETGLASTEFVASTMVDFATSALTGLAAGGLIAVLIAGFSLSVPLSAAILMTGIVGFLLYAMTDFMFDADSFKQQVANGLTAWGGIFENAMTIEGARMENESQLVSDWMELLQADQAELDSPATE